MTFRLQRQEECQETPVISDLSQRLNILGLDASKCPHMVMAWQTLCSQADAVFEHFNDHIVKMWSQAALHAPAITPISLQKTQHRYLESLFCSSIDAHYVADRLKVGQVHHRIGLDAHWYLASCQNLHALLRVALSHINTPPYCLETVLSTLHKRLFLDMGIVMNAYVHADRSALKKSNRSLRQSQMLLQQAQELVGLAYWELQLPEGHLRTCARSQQLLHTPSESTNDGLMMLRRWVHRDDLEELDNAVQSAIAKGGSYDVRYRVCHPAHPDRMVREQARVHIRSNGTLRLFGTAQDISQQVNQLSRIEQLALYDDLTGLPNRANVMSALENALFQATQATQSLAVMFIDLDDFKEINDTLGHGAGDVVLKEVSHRLRHCLRSNELIGRLGGDEFIVIAHAVDRDQAQSIAKRLATALSQPLQVNGAHITSRASIGIAMYPDDGHSSELLIRNADTAMYAAKQQHQSIASYQQDMRETLLRRVTMTSRLSSALENGQFELHFQPQIRLSDGQIIGAEALVRWRDAEMGEVPPSEFITLAESRGLIQQLGEWVVEAACLQLRSWDEAGWELPGKLALNVSPREFDNPNFAERLYQRTCFYGISPQRIELELTETGVMTDPEKARRALLCLRNAGFSLSLDDFGMGYSSLTRLKGFPLDRIKLDRSFVAGMLDDPHDYAIVVATLAMAKSLNLSVVAEGIENAQQAAGLSEMGCRFAQGFHFGWPMDADSFADAWLKPFAATQRTRSHGAVLA